MRYRKGDVVLVPFPFSDAEAAKRRPAVVVQSDSLNRRLDTVIIAQVTSNTARAKKEKSQLFVDIGTSEGARTGLLTDSAVKCETVATLSAGRILRRIGKLSGGLKKGLDASLRFALDL